MLSPIQLGALVKELAVEGYVYIETDDVPTVTKLLDHSGVTYKVERTESNAHTRIDLTND